MGRWAQARRRGRGVSGEPALPLSPPVFEVDFDLTGGTELINVEILVSCPGDADGAGTQYSETGENDWQDGLVASCGDTTDIVTSLAPGTYDVRIRWVGDGGATPLSDWSDVETVAVS